MNQTKRVPSSTQSADVTVRLKEITPRQALSVSCQACGAAVRQCCELRAGGIRKKPHRARLLLAANKLNAAALRRPAKDRHSTAAR